MRRSVVVAWVLVALSGCQEAGPDPADPGDGNGDGNGDPTPAITLAVSAATISVPQGGTGQLTVTVSRIGGFVGEVQLAVEGVPVEVQAQLTPAALPPQATTSQLTLSASGTAAPGTFTLTLRATGAGVEARTFTLTLTVTEVATPGFTLTLVPSQLTIQQGASATTLVQMARTGGYTNPVSLSLTGLPPGLNGTFDPPAYLSTNPVLTVGASYNAPVGQHTLTVHATGPNQPERTATLTVEITPANPTGEVTWTFCPASGQPLWFAYQDGDGPWTHVTGLNGIYAFDLSSTRGAVAWVRQGASGYELFVHYATHAELNQLGAALCGGSTVTKTVTGTVVNAGSDNTWVSFGGDAAVLPSGTSAFTLTRVRGGPQDLLASRIGVAGNGALTLVKLLLRRGLDLPDGGALAPIDFASAEAFDAAGFAITLENVGSDLTQLVASYRTANGPTAPYYADGLATAGNVRVYPAIPASRQQPGDFHVLRIVAAPGGGGATADRTATLVVGPGANRTARLGPALSGPTLTVPSASPWVRLRAQYPIQPEYNRYWTLSWAQADRSVFVAVTAAWAGTVSTVDVAAPDFTGVAGWDPQWAPRPGQSTTWVFEAAGWTDADGLNAPPFVDGAFGLSGRRTGTITP